MINARLLGLRRAAGAFLVDGFFRGSSKLAQLHPRARPEKHHVEVVRDVAYLGSGADAHRLDVYRPTRHAGPRPVVLYVHGGGFRILSKDSHWVMALAFARQGYVVFNINYRLAPQHPFPAALEDCAEAYRWVLEHAAEFGGDPGRLVLAGESAGANLVTALTVAACYERPEAYAKRVFETGVVPVAVLPACGILQVSDVDRFARRRPIAPVVMDRLHEVAHAYLPRDAEARSDLAMADPLLVVEGATTPTRQLPPFFIPCGTKDPLLDDSRRLGRALERLGAEQRVDIYPGEVHAFHAFVWRPHARACWRASHEFLRDVLDRHAQATSR